MRYAGTWQVRAAAAALALAVGALGTACRNPSIPPRTTTTTSGGITTTTGSGTTTTTTPGERPGDPGTGPWAPVPRERVAEECDLDPAALDAASRRITTGFTVVRYGKLCWASGPTTTRFAVWSVTKTWGALLVGMVSARSTMRDTDLVSKWLSPTQMGSINRSATIAHVMAMTSTSRSLAPGAKNRYSYDTVGTRELNRLIDVMNSVISREPANFGGARDIYDYVARTVLPKLGMTNSSWPRGSAIAYGLQSTVQDLGRMGLLILRKGNWGGEQLITEEYMYRMTHPSFPDSNTGLGYATWLNAQNMLGPSGRAHPNCAPYAQWAADKQAAFPESKTGNGSPFPDQQHDVGVAWAAGMGGQWTTVHRGLDLVISGRNVTGGGNWVLWDSVRPAVVAHDPVYQGNNTAFCAAYRRGTHAPTLLSPWN
jgi:CubicO group peptidase (beta-lactamase class C family)